MQNEVPVSLKLQDYTVITPPFQKVRGVDLQKIGLNEEVAHSPS